MERWRGVDIDALANGEVLSYSLADNAGGRFAINSSTGQITVANGSRLNRETNSSHAIVVRATDAANATFDKTFTISVANVNEAPLDLSTSTQSIAITNHSFEENVLADGAWSSGGVNGWTITGTAGSFNPATVSFPSGLAPDGSNVAIVIASSISQTLSTSFDASLNYRLAVDVGRRLEDFPIANYTVQLFAGSTEIGSYTNTTADRGTFGTVNIVANGSSFASANGEVLRIVLSTTGTQASFDNVRLTSSSATATIAENSSTGAVVATASGLDFDSGDTLTYSLQNDAGGRFAINGSTGQITVANGSLLDFETSTSHAIIARADRSRRIVV